jgi:hypothetical protein
MSSSNPTATSATIELSDDECAALSNRARVLAYRQADRLSGILDEDTDAKELANTLDDVHNIIEDAHRALWVAVYPELFEATDDMQHIVEMLRDDAYKASDGVAVDEEDEPFIRADRECFEALAVLSARMTNLRSAAR